MRKKILSLTLLCCFFCIASTQAFASEINAPVAYESDFISPHMNYIARANCNLYINSAGVATVKASVIGYQGTTTKTSIDANLQQYKNGSWTTIKAFPTSNGTCDASLTETYGISRGYSYRVQATINAYSGSSSETRTVTSSESTY